MTTPEDDPDQHPTRTEEEAKDEAKVVAKGGVRIAAVSIFATLLTVIGLLQASGLIDLFPFGEGWTLQWLVFVVIAVFIVALELWSWSNRR